jgi:hypothetical protein
MRCLASMQAGITMFALIAMSSPLMVMAQEETPAPETESTEVVSEDTVIEEEEGSEESLQTALEDLLILAKKDKDEDEDEDEEEDGDEQEEGENVFRIVKVIEGGEASFEDFSFTVTLTEEDDGESEVEDVQHYSFDEDGVVEIEVGDDEDEFYSVTEDSAPNYVASYEGCEDVSFGDDDEDERGPESRGDDEDEDEDNEDDDEVVIKTCTITNTYEAPEVPQSCSIVSNTTDFYIEGDHNAVPTFTHNSWTTIPGALWIWGDAFAQEPRDGETQSFEKEFTVTGTPTSATLTYAADNGTLIKINGTTVVDQDLPGLDTTDFNFDATDSVVITNLHSGVNTIEITVRNIPFDTDSAQDNPAGVIYKLAVTGADCDEIPHTDEPTPEPTVCAPGVELLANGGFEAPAVSAGDWNLFASGTSGLSWVVDWLGASVSGRPAVANIEIQNGVNGWSATSTGSQWAELDSDWSTSSTGNPSATIISQDIPTVVGETYTFSFDASARPGTDASDNTLEAIAGGVSLGTVGPLAPSADTVWSHQVFSFEATSTVTRVSLRDAGVNNNSFGALVDNASLKCEAPEVPVETATLHTVKIVCDDESYLPNWGDHLDSENQAVSITANTAAAFLAEVNADREVPVCRLAPDWQFQWTTNTESSVNPGNTGVAGAPWHTTAVTDANGAVQTEIPVGDKIWVREILKDNYISFTGGNTTESESAEIYCATDVLNYDNWDWIDPVLADEDYYCVAFNAPEPETPPVPVTATISATKVMCDAEQYLPNSGDIANPITAGTAAAWVAQSEGHCQLEGGYDFQWAPNGTGDPEDNGTVALGSPWTTFGSTDVNGFVSTQVNVASALGVIQVREVLKTGDIPYVSDESGAKLYCASDVAGVDNWEWISAPVAGQTYHCVAFNAHEGSGDPETPTDPNAGQDKVHIYKHLKTGEVTAQIPNDSTAPSFPMVSTWQAGNLSAGATSSGAYVLGNNEGGTALKYAADTSPMDNGSYYTTSEVTGGDSVVVPNDGQCSPGKYRLLGYKSGTSLENAESASLSLTAPEFFNITSDKYVIVVNEACPSDDGGGDNDGTVVIVKHSVGGDGTFAFDLSEQELIVGVFVPDATIPTTDGYGTTTLTVNPGAYNLTEYLQEGWTLQGVTCEYDGESEGTTIQNGKTIYVGANDTVTCTFTNVSDSDDSEPTPETPQDNDDDGNTGNRVRSPGNSGGLVLGASTECSPLLMTYLGKSFINAPTEVTKLQNFLNEEMGTALPVSGAFDKETEEAVHAFQIKYWEEVLKPWFGLPGSPIQDSDDSSGIVFKTTKWKINDLFCPGSEAFPSLP